MNIIIAGGGKVGGTLAEQLAAEKHSVTIIDTNQDILDRLNNQLDVLCIRGSCTSRGTLIEAGAGDADVIIAATDSDEVNLLCCHCAHRLGVPHSVARVRDTGYMNDLDSLRGDLGITMLVNPELSAAVEISRILRFPSASNVETFARGRVELVSFQVQPQDFLADHSLAELSSKIQSLPILFCAVERGVRYSSPTAPPCCARGTGPIWRALPAACTSSSGCWAGTTTGSRTCSSWAAGASCSTCWSNWSGWA